MAEEIKVNKIVIPKEGLQFVSEEGKVLFEMKATEYDVIFSNNNQKKLVGAINAEKKGCLGIYDNNKISLNFLKNFGILNR